MKIVISESEREREVFHVLHRNLKCRTLSYEFSSRSLATRHTIFFFELDTQNVYNLWVVFCVLRKLATVAWSERTFYNSRLKMAYKNYFFHNFSEGSYKFNKNISTYFFINFKKSPKNCQVRSMKINFLFCTTRSQNTKTKINFFAIALSHSRFVVQSLSFQMLNHKRISPTRCESLKCESYLCI